VPTIINCPNPAKRNIPHKGPKVRDTCMSTLDSACSRKRKLTADVNEPTYIQEEEEANHDSPRRKIRRRENSTEL
jgi:hypothetical protein